jgi:hypothetical protein
MQRHKSERGWRFTYSRSSLTSDHAKGRAESAILLKVAASNRTFGQRHIIPTLVKMARVNRETCHAPKTH